MDVLATHVADALADASLHLTRRALALVNRALSQRIHAITRKGVSVLDEIPLVPLCKPLPIIAMDVLAVAIIRSSWPEQTYDAFFSIPYKWLPSEWADLLGTLAECSVNPLAEGWLPRFCRYWYVAKYASYAAVASRSIKQMDSPLPPWAIETYCILVKLLNLPLPPLNSSPFPTLVRLNLYK